MKVVNNALTISNSGDMSQTTLTSNAQPCDSLWNIVIQCVVAGGTSPTGTLQAQVSCDPAGVAPTNWSAIGSSVSVTANGVYTVPVVDNGAQWVRVLYTKTSGTGTLTARVNAKGL